MDLGSSEIYQILIPPVVECIYTSKSACVVLSRPIGAQALVEEVSKTFHYLPFPTSLAPCLPAGYHGGCTGDPKSCALLIIHCIPLLKYFISIYRLWPILILYYSIITGIWNIILILLFFN